MAEGKTEGEAAADSNVQQLARNAQWNKEHGNTDAARREQALVNMVTRKRG